MRDIKRESESDKLVYHQKSGGVNDTDEKNKSCTAYIACDAESCLTPNTGELCLVWSYTLIRQTISNGKTSLEYLSLCMCV